MKVCEFLLKQHFGHGHGEVVNCFVVFVEMGQVYNFRYVLRFAPLLELQMAENFAELGAPTTLAKFKIDFSHEIT